MIFTILFLNIILLFNCEEKKNNSTEQSADILTLLTKLFINTYQECKVDLERIEPKTIKVTLSKYPFIVDNIGKGLNDLGDEIECRHAYVGTQYVIAEMTIENLINLSEKKLKDFLNISTFNLGACITEGWKEPLREFISIFLNFQNGTTSGILFNETTTHPTISDTNYKIIIIYILFVYVVIKLIFGIIRLIFFPKGYNKEAIRRINEKKGDKTNELLADNEENNNEISNDTNNDNKNNIINSIGNNDENDLSIRSDSRIRSDSIVSKNEKIVSLVDADTKEYNPEYDYSTIFNWDLTIVRFFDCFNDMMLLSDNRNRYFNDKGLETINFCRATVLYFLVFYHTFISLFKLPSKDILNKSFFSSNMLFIFRLSTHSINCWIFLEAAYGAYKLMCFIKTQILKSKSKMNFYIQLLIIYGKFIVLFIPQIILFLLCYYFCYQDIIQFQTFFGAKTTFTYIHDKVITKDMRCDNESSLIFTPFTFFTYIGDNNADNITDFNNITYSNWNACYNFTFIYVNIFLSSLVFMIILYIIFLAKNKIVDIIIIMANLIAFFTLILAVEDIKAEETNPRTTLTNITNIINGTNGTNITNITTIPKNETVFYRYYHFKGQEYTNKIFYLSLGVYHLGFIIGIICFNYNNLKDAQGGDKKDNNDLPYYPLSFFNKLLIALKKITFKIKGLIIVVCLGLMILLSFGYTFLKEEEENIQQSNTTDSKNTTNSTDNYYNETRRDERDKNLVKIYSGGAKFYFRYERHFFLLLFFIINFIMITIEKKGFYKKIMKFKLSTAISRTGLIITCLYDIFGYFSYCGFILKIKFNLPTFFIISIGNFLVLFILCFILNIIIGLPFRRLVKKLLRYQDEKIRKQTLQKKIKSASKLII